MMDESIPYDIFAGGPPGLYQLYGLPSTPLPNTQHRHHQHFEAITVDGFAHPYQPFEAHFPYAQNDEPLRRSPSERFLGEVVGPVPESKPSLVPSETLTTPTEEQQAQAISSGEEKDSGTPANNRRKEQNRAAQRAFRERKERHVKDLEQKLAALQQDFSTSQSDNERLKRELAKVATERDILRATSSPSHPLNAVSDEAAAAEEEPTQTGPMHFVPTDSYKFVKEGAGQAGQRIGKVSTPHRASASPSTGQRLLSAGETWDYIQGHELYERGLVDIGDVCERLKRLARCNGGGPNFEEADVKVAIEASAKGRKDEFL